jgi:chemosensory pili system protein ChpC
MRRLHSNQLHSLEIPLTAISLLLPSGCIAEVISYSRPAPVASSAPWVTGTIAWRTLEVPVISFETLMGFPDPGDREGSKIVVLYPLKGRREFEFVGLVSVTEPKPRAVEEAGYPAADAADLPDTPYLAAGFNANGRLLAIPDLDALKHALYPR